MAVSIGDVRPLAPSVVPRFIDPQSGNFPATRINHLLMVTGGTAKPADAELVRRALDGERDAFEGSTPGIRRSSTASPA